MDSDFLRVSVVYALPDRQVQVRLRVEPGTTVERVVALSGLLREFPEISSRPLTYAVFGRVVAATQTVGSGDRIEVLRPLLVDPKENRRKAAARAKRR